MRETRWAQVWLATGLLWFLLAIAFAPTNKIYQQGLVAFLWLPTLFLAWSARARLAELWQAQRLLCLAVLALGAWALLTLLWTQDPDPSRGAKRALYVIVFLLFFPVLANARPERVIRVMQWGGLGLALTAVLAAIKFYLIDDNLWTARLVGLGQLAHPILGGYVLGLAAVWLAHWIPQERWKQAVWVVALAFLCGFVVLSQSRGAALALLLTFVSMPIWSRDRHSRLIAVGALTMAMFAFWLLEPLVMARGASFRPQILMASLDMIAQHPWRGLGLGSAYSVFTEGHEFDHAHNLFTHITIELGLPGLLLWCVVWFAVLREAWRARDTVYGRGIIGIWMFSFLAMQFDAASISGSPRAEWFISWLPVGLASVLVWTQAKFKACDKIPRST
ncbi:MULTISPECIES: O-antigen ligase family protein [Pseudomonas]|jgi:O-antigen ligase|uniref:O-antigen ligase family protein n=1 Tax=Pseudomonas kielensis TaxID=2762577 RepID=A0A7X1G9N1_9PSED|nr:MULTISPECIES: O-antigen ligase family protein [Pseudomonas]MBC2688429.1 O-antigen ligase family protein [Pseudomonas kielensis]NBB36125.1 polymerase [Pseudomonas sp. BC115LW]WKL54485.1 O-antigen ligase family protein [Pseudomonas kielensis]